MAPQAFDRSVLLPYLRAGWIGFASGCTPRSLPAERWAETSWTLEHLAAELLEVTFAPGGCVMREGDAGDRFYLVRTGELRVTAGGRDVAVVGPGGFVGEIALLSDVPRTATVTALGEASLYALERDEFPGRGDGPHVQRVGRRRRDPRPAAIAGGGPVRQSRAGRPPYTYRCRERRTEMGKGARA